MSAKKMPVLVLCVAALALLAGCCKKKHVIVENPPQPRQQSEICFNVQPAGARVEIDGNFRAAGTGCVTVEPGRHSVKVTKPGYLPFEAVVDVAPGAQRTVSTRLEMAPAIPQPAPPKPQPAPPRTEICFNVQPASASVELDGNYVGMANRGCINVSPGRHVVRISKPNFIAYEKTIDIAPGSQRTINTRLSKDQKFTHNPGPPTKTVPPGKVVEPEPPAQQPAPMPVPAPVPAPAKSQICFDVQPASAFVEIDGNNVGMANRGCMTVAPGRHVVKISKPNFVTYSSTLDVASGQKKTVSARLAKEQKDKGKQKKPPKAAPPAESGPPANDEVPTPPVAPVPAPAPAPAPAQSTICFKVQPASAEVDIDGKHVGSANGGCVEVSPGEHAVKIYKDNFTDYERTVYVQAGKSVAVSAKLENAKKNK